ncbi:hypothetical protein ACEPPN_009508 [Leptodophora sp. 'Broadleaf-Isolate-01']
MAHDLTTWAASRVRSLLSHSKGQEGNVDDDREQLYMFTSDLFPVLNNAPSQELFTAFAIYSPLSKHNWISKRYAERTLGIVEFEVIPQENTDDELTRAIEQLQIYTNVDVIFGQTSSCDKKVSLKKALRKGIARVYNPMAGQELAHPLIESEGCNKDEHLDLVSFERGIATGVLIPVDDDIGSDEDATLRPSFAKLKQYHDISQAVAREICATDEDCFTRGISSQPETSDISQQGECTEAEQPTKPDADAEAASQCADKRAALKTKREDDAEKSRNKRRRSGLLESTVV